MNVDKTAYLIFDPWQVQPPPYESDYVNNVNDYMGNKIVEYLQDVPQHNKFVCMFTSMAETYGVHKGMKKYDFLRHQDVPDRMVKGNFDNLIYCGFHHGRCTLDTKDSGAKFTSQHKRKWNIYFKKELLCLLPGDSWLEMDKKSQQYGELI